VCLVGVGRRCLVERRCEVVEGDGAFFYEGFLFSFFDVGVRVRVMVMYTLRDLHI
jgi:hypothetical protein